MYIPSPKSAHPPPYRDATKLQIYILFDKPSKYYVKPAELGPG